MQATIPSKSLRTELEELLGAPYRVTLSGGEVCVTPMRFGDLPELLRCLDAWQREPATADGDLHLLELTTGLEADFLKTLNDADLEALLAASKAVNPTLYREEAGAVLTRRPSAPGGIETAVALLIEAGHTLAAVEGYTLAQIDRLSLAHARLAAERRIDELMIARAAQADSKGFKHAVASLQRSLGKLGGKG